MQIQDLSFKHFTTYIVEPTKITRNADNTFSCKRCGRPYKSGSKQKLQTHAKTCNPDANRPEQGSFIYLYIYISFKCYYMLFPKKINT